MTERLDKPVASLADVYASVSLSEPLLSRGQKQRLNPLVIQVRSATKMPSVPVPFAELKARFVRYYILLEVLCFFDGLLSLLFLTYLYTVFLRTLHSQAGREKYHCIDLYGFA